MRKENIMKTLHVGGFGFKHFKTLEQALEKALDDDVIVLHKDTTISKQVNKSIVIQGNNHKLTVESDQAGLICNNFMIIKDLKLHLHPRSNGICLLQGGKLDNIQVTLEGQVVNPYPAIWLQGGNCEVRNSKLEKVCSEENTNFTFLDCEFNDYFGREYYFANHETSSIFHGTVNISHCNLSMCSFYGETNIQDSIIGQYVSNYEKLHVVASSIEPLEITPLSSKRKKKEPSHGIMQNITEEYFLLKSYKASLHIEDYTTTNDDTYYTLACMDSDVLLEKSENPNISNHYFQNCNLSLNCVKDHSYVVKENTKVSLVRSDFPHLGQNEETAMSKLEKLIGLNSVKTKIKSIMNTINASSETDDDNFAFSYHMIFAGDPGTGKSTVARIVAQALYEIGAIPQNKCTQVTVDSLIKGYVGQTAENVRRILDDALGGVVFIDEAYELSVKEGTNSFNSEALSVLIRYMEDHRKDLIVIAAGYSKEMKQFLASNIGMQRRFQWVEFEDYTCEELTQIFEMMMKSYKKEFENPEIVQTLPLFFTKLTAKYLSIPDSNGRKTNGGNGGLVRNCFEQVILAHNNRRAQHPESTEKITRDDLKIGFNEEVQKVLHFQSKN